MLLDEALDMVGNALGGERRQGLGQRRLAGGLELFGGQAFQVPHAQLALQLARDRLGQAAGLAAELAGELAVQHLSAELGRAVVQHAAGQRGGAHALHDLLHEQGLELAGGLADAAAGVARGLGLELIEAAQALAGHGLEGRGGHQITSSSALRAPALFMACRMASRSWGVAPSEFKALTTSDRRAPAGNWIRLPGSWRTEMSVFSATAVWPLDSALGWLMIGVELIVTDRLPWATAQDASVTAWFMTIEPVRALMTTRAAGVAMSTLRFSTSARKATRSSGVSGARTRTTRPSRAWAVPGPLALLMAWATARAVAKSLLLRSNCRVSPWASGVGTERSTRAPAGMRPALRWLICTLEPPADAPAPPTTRLPWAIA
mmetsp:Transcript_22405/g.88713  ORF Transcript_22405/g.88713 Transcript_22405/m.88713 type:complete len:376 (+) Transcript_22405:100-1227(+)